MENINRGQLIKNQKQMEELLLIIFKAFCPPSLLPLFLTLFSPDLKEINI